MRPFQACARITLLIGLFVVTCACTDSTPDTLPVFPDNSFAVYALSRGKGVPAPAREAMQSVRRLFEEAKQRGKVLRIVQTRLGLEGESRLCAEFATSEAARDTWVRVHRLVEGRELMNLVVEPCEQQ